MVRGRSGFILLIALVFLASTAQPETSPPCITVVELLHDAPLHNRTVVTVSGWLHAGFETSLLLSYPEEIGPLDQAIWFDDIEFVKANEQMWPELKKDQATTEPALSPTAQRLYRKFLRQHSKRLAPVIVPVVLRGEFQTSNQRIFSGPTLHRLIFYEVISIGSK